MVHSLHYLEFCFISFVFLIAPSLCVEYDCGGGTGVDLSPLTKFGTLTAITPRIPHLTVYAAVCGTVTAPACQQLPSNINSSVCFSNDFATFRVAAAEAPSQWIFTSDVTRAAGIVQMTKSGYTPPICNGTQFTANITYRCNPAAKDGPILGATPANSEDGCGMWQLTVETDLEALCNATASIPVIDLPGCGYDGIDLSPLAAFGELQYVAADQRRYYFAICGTVLNSRCLSDLDARTSQLCMVTPSLNTPFRIISNELTAISKRWERLTPDGEFPTQLQLNSADGERFNCPAPRVAAVQFICDPSADTPTFTATTTNDCQFYVVVNTSLLCNKSIPTPPPVVIPGCGFDDIDLSSLLEDDDLVYVDNDITVYMRPCGTVVSPICLSDEEAITSSVCAVSPLGVAYRIVSDSLLDSTVEWSALGPPNSRQLLMTTSNGESDGCQNNRTATTMFVCDSKAKRPYLTAISPDNCDYKLAVYSNMTCGTK